MMPTFHRLSNAQIKMMRDYVAAIMLKNQKNYQLKSDAVEMISYGSLLVLLISVFLQKGSPL